MSLRGKRESEIRLFYLIYKELRKGTFDEFINKFTNNKVSSSLLKEKIIDHNNKVSLGNIAYFNTRIDREKYEDCDGFYNAINNAGLTKDEEEYVKKESAYFMYYDIDEFEQEHWISFIVGYNKSNEVLIYGLEIGNTYDDEIYLKLISLMKKE